MSPQQPGEEASNGKLAWEHPDSEQGHFCPGEGGPGLQTARAACSHFKRGKYEKPASVLVMFHLTGFSVCNWLEASFDLRVREKFWDRPTISVVVVVVGTWSREQVCKKEGKRKGLLFAEEIVCFNEMVTPGSFVLKPPLALYVLTFGQRTGMFKNLLLSAGRCLAAVKHRSSGAPSRVRGEMFPCTHMYTLTNRDSQRIKWGLWGSWRGHHWGQWPKSVRGRTFPAEGDVRRGHSAWGPAIHLGASGR